MGSGAFVLNRLGGTRFEKLGTYPLCLSSNSGEAKTTQGRGCPLGLSLTATPNTHSRLFLGFSPQRHGLLGPKAIWNDVKAKKHMSEDPYNQLGVGLFELTQLNNYKFTIESTRQREREDFRYMLRTNELA
ncbi:hypothetical protein Sjap_006379 [Stephania japonica]|uniref:Uncharacterized protein n=1 Tax=Stephania japonica TaxID=461633 RepID=A0AAP0K5P7_9MAGN